MNNSLIALQQGDLKKKETFEELIDRFIRDQDVAVSSKGTYRSALRQFFTWFSRKRVPDPTRETILDYKKWLDDKGLRTFTRSSYLVAVRRFFEWAESLKLYPNIARGVKGTRRSTKVHQKDALTIPQIEKVMSIIDKSELLGVRDYALINLLFRTGLRLIEIKRAAIGDMDMKEDGTAILWVRGKGKDGKDDFVVLTNESLKPIMRYLKERKPRNKQEPLFASLSDRNRGQMITIHSLSRLIKQRFRRAGIDNRRITPHSLRHTFGVMAIRSGSSLYEVQLAMRHTAPTTTEVYLGDIEQAKRMEGGPEKRISELFAGVFEDEE